MNVRAELASRFIEVENLPWEKTAYAGIEQKTLLVDKQTGLITALMRMAPGARLPDHEHVKIEQTYVLEGSLSARKASAAPGSSSGAPRAAATKRGPDRRAACSSPCSRSRTSSSSATAASPISSARTGKVLGSEMNDWAFRLLRRVVAGLSDQADQHHRAGGGGGPTARVLRRRWAMR